MALCDMKDFLVQTTSRRLINVFTNTKKASSSYILAKTLFQKNNIIVIS